jgi:hypothetical protein
VNEKWIRRLSTPLICGLNQNLCFFNLNCIRKELTKSRLQFWNPFLTFALWWSRSEWFESIESNDFKREKEKETETETETERTECVLRSTESRERIFGDVFANFCKSSFNCDIFVFWISSNITQSQHTPNTSHSLSLVLILISLFIMKYYFIRMRRLTKRITYTIEYCHHWLNQQIFLSFFVEFVNQFVDLWDCENVKNKSTEIWVEMRKIQQNRIGIKRNYIIKCVQHINYLLNLIDLVCDLNVVFFRDCQKWIQWILHSKENKKI